MTKFIWTSINLGLNPDFSLDVEGAEWQIIQSIPWDLVDIKVSGLVGETLMWVNTLFTMAKLIRQNNFIKMDSAQLSDFINQLIFARVTYLSQLVFKAVIPKSR